MLQLAQSFRFLIIILVLFSQVSASQEKAETEDSSSRQDSRNSFFYQNYFSTEHDAILQEMYQTKTRDDRVAFLKQVLIEKPDHPFNVEFEYRIAGLLHSNTMGGQPTKPREALPHYEAVLKNYNYDDYYVSRYQEGTHWTKLRQSVMVQSAINASGLSKYDADNPDKSREYAYQALEMLNNTFQRRTNDWLTAEKPIAPDNIIQEFSFSDYTKNYIKSRYQGALGRWESRMKRAKAGDVFEETEQTNALLAFSYYVGTYDRKNTEMLHVAWNKIINDFPGTPMAEFAQNNMDLTPIPIKVVESTSTKSKNSISPWALVSLMLFLGLSIRLAYVNMRKNHQV